MALECQVERRVEERMSRADKCREVLSLGCDEAFLKYHSLIARENWGADADGAVARAHRRGDLGDLVAARLTLVCGAAQAPEGFEEEGLDVVGLESACFGALHFLADARYAARVHGVVCEGTLLDEVLE